jgi:hypothetical protein
LAALDSTGRRLCRSLKKTSRASFPGCACYPFDGSLYTRYHYHSRQRHAELVRWVTCGALVLWERLNCHGPMRPKKVRANTGTGSVHELNQQEKGNVAPVSQAPAKLCWW